MFEATDDRRPSQPKRQFRSWWFVEMYSPDGRFNQMALAMMVVVGMTILVVGLILLAT